MAKLGIHWFHSNINEAKSEKKYTFLMLLLTIHDNFYNIYTSKTNCIRVIEIVMDTL